MFMAHLKTPECAFKQPLGKNTQAHLDTRGTTDLQSQQNINLLIHIRGLRIKLASSGKFRLSPQLISAG